MRINGSSSSLVDDRKLDMVALLGLEGEAWRDDALAMLHGTSHAAKLQQLVLDLHSTAALAGAVRAFVSQRQAGV